MTSFNLAQQARTERLPLDKLLEQTGRKGGGTPYGWHTFATRFQCWFKYHLSEHLKVDRYYSPALAIGTLLHEILATWYSTPLGEDPSGPIEEMLAVCREHGYEKAVDETMRLAEAYLGYWMLPEKKNGVWVPRKAIRDSKQIVIARPDDFFSPGTEIIAVEEMLQTDTPFNYTCRMDMAVRRRDGIWIVDHKTARALDGSVTDWALQGEILGLLWLAQKKWGNEVKGLIINLIVKTKVPKFERMSFRLRPRNIKMHLDAIKALLDIQPIAEKHGWPRAMTSCAGQYRCAYFSYCRDGIKADLKHDGKLIEVDEEDNTLGQGATEDPPPFGGIEWSMEP